MWVEVALAGGSDHGGEGLLGGGAAPGPIAAADLARDDGGPDGVFGAPVGGVDGLRVVEEGEQRGPFGSQMRGEAPHVGEWTRVGHPPGEALDERVEVGGRERAGATAGPQFEGALQVGLDVGDDATVRMVGSQQPTAAEQVRETSLVGGRGELPIRRPAIADEHACEVVAEQGGSLRVTPSGFDGVDRRRGCRRGPQPLEASANLPPGLVGRDDGAAANLLAQGRIGRLRPPTGAVDGVHQPAATDGQTVLLPQQRGDLAERQTQLLVENGCRRDHLRTELHPGGAERIGSLQSMTALHAAAARPAGPNGHPERTHDYSRSRQLFLKLRRQPRRLQPAAAIRTGRRQRGIVSFIHSPRLSPPRRDAIAGTRSASWTPRAAFERLGKWCCLTTTRTARRRQLPLQPLVLVLQPLVALVQPPIVPLQLVPFAFDPLELAAQSFRSLAPPILRLGPTSCLTLHTTFMAYSLSKYNPIIWIAGPDPVTSYDRGKQCDNDQLKRRWRAYRCLVDELHQQFKGQGTRWNERAMVGSILQHYGIKTPWLDVVRNLHTAIWFATHEVETRGNHLVVSLSNNTHGHIAMYCPEMGAGLKHVDLWDSDSSRHVRPHAQHGISLAKQCDDADAPLEQQDLSKPYRIAQVCFPNSLKWALCGYMFSAGYFFPDPEHDTSLKQLCCARIEGTLDRVRRQHSVDLGVVTRYMCG